MPTLWDLASALLYTHIAIFSSRLNPLERVIEPLYNVNTSGIVCKEAVLSREHTLGGPILWDLASAPRARGDFFVDTYSTEKSNEAMVLMISDPNSTSGARCVCKGAVLSWG